MIVQYGFVFFPTSGSSPFWLKLCYGNKIFNESWVSTLTVSFAHRAIHELQSQLNSEQEGQPNVIVFALSENVMVPVLMS